MSQFRLPLAVKGLLLDAGNTLVFLDMDAVSTVVGAIGVTVDSGALQTAEPSAKLRYAAFMRDKANHDDGWGVFMSTLLSTAGVPENAITASVEALRREQRRFNLWRRVPAGLIDALQRARKNDLPVGVLSNAEGNIERLLRRVDLVEYFDTIVDSGLVGMAKPDPRIFQLAASKMGLRPDELVYVGDIPGVDVVGANSAGMPAILIDPFGHFREYRGAERCSTVAEVIDDLLERASSRDSNC